MQVSRVRHTDCSAPDESGEYAYDYEYDIYHFVDGAIGLIARSYTDTPEEAHFLNIEVDGTLRLLTQADLAQPLFALAQDYLRQEGKRELRWLSGRGDGYEPLPGGMPSRA
ncbi:hypothetical protein VDQ16_00565 [Xanthomonas campestris pv. campestris]|nr:hypothetical protein [Xanthomonas campestris pv. campestris]MEB1321348.1 hypothetical protein [Xanthomonas campestris pv. campestris]MEB1354402.1 hypothetical protein [Xanthomonas campestris pv. campestris]MEB1421721.1 hypothetical protein [Xanthomonas campestris pv. campestris]MEB1445334.1 hypothetical protein [Xanthomonas campestris pv. campestris]